MGTIDFSLTLYFSLYHSLLFQTGINGAETINFTNKTNYFYALFVNNFGNNIPLQQSGAFVDIYGLREGKLTLFVRTGINPYLHFFIHPEGQGRDSPSSTITVFFTSIVFQWSVLSRSLNCAVESVF